MSRARRSLLGLTLLGSGLFLAGCLKGAPPPAGPPGGGCDPNYAGACVPIDPVDVDCAGGSGDGPSYVAGPVQVVGVDVYDLDDNNNGIGCE